jgi:hypothetical protein
VSRRSPAGDATSDVATWALCESMLTWMLTSWIFLLLQSLQKHRVKRQQMQTYPALVHDIRKCPLLSPVFVKLLSDSVRSWHRVPAFVGRTILLFSFPTATTPPRYEASKIITTWHGAAGAPMMFHSMPHGGCCIS